ncbi:uncharacterized protein GVI51_M11561 [Nakaseomyces glabratus]|uniref:tRNA-splicing endonuclease subunit Sen2 n=1 Tax=Candida glabrata (strain ATCC 2001 / BCRC 20586 / JCM 3761 / NBRC 0622 / NRRL Y-65 / CBS 138) TaxID=284593 RepID=Q6FIU9_CANGA|nr:uncharacterized protein CAGL0M11594g [Nakaseomyces glabratus]KAH7594042.1 tRNA intron endonuclease, catalytic C-terminal domain [Nakaseomyces glabratus]KAH7600492.1 tRNA intron endonuclease, catalytic C-terminal domain [Nakaseomyces glabratus]QHS69537.1 uncharacterized protein GVI51_M11561 [Nakaseomyces glabratus]CAG62825.1 unnamed protein product [Nakaseomyces glabratus]|eukprot:XP_449845.1 uncharacterized protein CAGL0M11594g [[Candida] glabrata]
MAKKQFNTKRYKFPLPIHPIDRNALPVVSQYNPISWLQWLYCLYANTNLLPKKLTLTIRKDEQGWCHLLVEDEQDMKYLWNNGFFGTGQMSRSEPTWKFRTEKRLKVNDAGDKPSGTMDLEKVTEIRRIQRLAFKKERLRLEGELSESRSQNISAEQETQIIEEHREKLRVFRSDQLKELNNLKLTAPETRDEDLELYDDSGEIRSLESMELMPVEAIFLTFALPVLDIKINDLIKHFEFQHIEELKVLVRKYAAYHHYRSLKWCVRSGIKFGCDYLLYKRGPPFQHAEFAIMVLDHTESHDYTWYSSVARVASGAKKTLILCYIDDQGLTNETLLDLWHQGNLVKLLQHFKVAEVTYKRWIPGKNRD